MNRYASDSERELLLTPGPLTTARATREAMLRDRGSRDGDFIAMTARIRSRTLAIANASPSHVCVPIQGSGTFAVEAMLGTMVPAGGKVLVLANGAYGRRMAAICGRIGRAHQVIETDEDTAPDPATVDAALADDPGLSHVAVVHCETTSGILNPVEEIAQAVAARGRALLIDGMSAFGALPFDAVDVPFAALAASPNKCLEGVPGMAFVLAERDALDAARDRAPSLALDLYDQWQALEANGQWRFTPPTHVVAAFDAALAAHAREGGVAARGARYRENCAILVEGMRALGFVPYLPARRQAPIIVTFHRPADPGFDFGAFYDRLKARGIVIYPGKVTQAETFRMGCIGDLRPEDMRRAVRAVAEVVDEMGLERLGPG